MVDKVDADTDRLKSEIIKDLAKSLEGKIPTDRIANEIGQNKEISRRVSQRLIYKCLDAKYKNESKASCRRLRKSVALVQQTKEDDKRFGQIEEALPIAVTNDGRSVRSEMEIITPPPPQTDGYDNGDTVQSLQHEETQQKELTEGGAFRVLVTYDEISDQMAEVYYPGITKMWLSGRIQGDQLLDVKLESVRQ